MQSQLNTFDLRIYHSQCPYHSDLLCAVALFYCTITQIIVNRVSPFSLMLNSVTHFMEYYSHLSLRIFRSARKIANRAMSNGANYKRAGCIPGQFPQDLAAMILRILLRVIFALFCRLPLVVWNFCISATVSGAHFAKMRTLLLL